MIRNRQRKLNRIVNKIRHGICEINQRYRSGPDLYFYRRLTTVRRENPDLTSFLQSEYNMEILYATLVSWDMNSRAAKMKYFDDFKSNIVSTLDDLRRLEGFFNQRNPQRNGVLQVLREVYCNLDLMRSGGKLVSRSKALHFLFPTQLIPMDGTNTLQYFYGNTGESVNKYLEITEVAFDIMAMDDGWQGYLDNGWNTSVPKMIDNAILLIEGHSLTNNGG